MSEGEGKKLQVPRRTYPPLFWKVMNERSIRFHIEGHIVADGLQEITMPVLVHHGEPHQ